jgi:hypothetical protein
MKRSLSNIGELRFQGIGFLRRAGYLSTMSPVQSVNDVAGSYPVSEKADGRKVMAESCSARRPLRFFGEAIEQ